MKAQLKNLWSDNRKYFLFACLLFGLGVVWGYLQSEAVEQIANALLEQLKDMVAKLEREGGGPLAVFWAIFKNNLFVSLFMMALGVFFAFLPVFSMLANGIVIGFILAKFHAAGINPWLMFTAGILPHGVFELAAVLFAAGVGIRLGVLSFRSVGSLIQPAKWGRVKNDWFDMLKQFPTSVITVIVLLFIAAIVETVVTPLIIQGVLGDQLKQINLFG